jgi:hypothetical protein
MRQVMERSCADHRERTVTMFTFNRLQLVLAFAGLASGCEGTSSMTAEGHAAPLAVAGQVPAASATAEVSGLTLRAILGVGDAGFVPRFLGSQIIGNSEIFQAGHRVIIGGTEPGARLQVQDNFAGPGSIFNIHQVDPTGDIALEFSQAPGTEQGVMGNVGVIRSGGGPERFVVLGHGRNPRNLPLTLAEDGANVGIGTASPAAPLHVRTRGQTLRFETSFGAMVIDFYAEGEFFGNLGLLRETPERFIILQNNPKNLPLALAENGGNVGIGTADPQKTLDVNGDGRFSGAVTVGGNLTVTGTKSSVATLSDGRRVLLYAIESPQNWFEDFGTAELSDGEAWVSLDSVFAETVNTAGSYHVFLTPNGNCNGLYIAEKRADGFVVRELGGGTSNVKFDYRIVAARRGFEEERLLKLP